MQRFSKSIIIILRDTAEGHKEIVTRSVSIEELNSEETPHAYEARVVQ